MEISGKFLTVDWGADSDFIGKDSVRFRVCEGGECSQFQTLSVVVAGIEEVHKELLKIEIYNGLSINDNGLNEYLEYYFVLPGGEKVSVPSELRVFNRWGEVVYANDEYTSSVDDEGGFDGYDMNSGNKLVEGTYFYTIKVNVNGLEGDFKGYIQLKH